MTEKKRVSVKAIFKRLSPVYTQNRWLILFFGAAAATLTLIYLLIAVPPLYRASATLYVNRYVNLIRPDGAPDTDTAAFTDSDAARRAIGAYAQIIQSDRVLSAAADEFYYNYNINLTAEDLRNTLSVRQVDGTEIFSVNITHPDPETALAIANIIARICPSAIAEVIEGSSARVIDYADMPTRRESPRYQRDTIIGALSGVLAALIFLTVQSLSDTRIRSEKDLSALCPDIPVIHSTPEFQETDFIIPPPDSSVTNQSDSSGNSGYQEPLYPYLSPAVREVFASPRDYLHSVLSGQSGGKIISVTSAAPGEGKSLIVWNLGLSFASVGKRVILIDTNFYQPEADKSIRPAKSSGGLSGLLANPGMLSAYIRPACPRDNLNHFSNFDFIASGPVPSNPSEALNSARMERVLYELKQNYDYIFLDCPSLQTAPDALIFAPKSDGVLFIVRAGYSGRESVSGAAEQLRERLRNQPVGARIAGFILNGAADSSGFISKSV